MINEESGRPALPASKPVWLVILLSIVTLAYYLPIWFLNRCRAVNQFYGHRFLGAWAPILVIFLMATSNVLDFVTTHPRGSPLNMTINLLDATSSLMLLVLSFRFRRYLIDYVGPQGSRVSGVWTFFLSIYYLQYKINRLNEQPAPSATTVPVRADA